MRALKQGRQMREWKWWDGKEIQKKKLKENIKKKQLKGNEGSEGK